MISTILFACALLGYQKSEVQGELSQDTLWKGSIRVVGDVVIPSGVTLTIAPGTVIEFVPNLDLTKSGFDKNKSEIRVDGGTVIAIGNPKELIAFEAYRQPDRLQVAAGDWTGLVLASGDLQLEFVTISQATRGIHVVPEHKALSISNCTFNSIWDSAIVTTGPLDLKNCRFNSIFSKESVSLSPFSQPSRFGAVTMLRGAGDLSVDRCEFRDCPFGGVLDFLNRNISINKCFFANSGVCLVQGDLNLDTRTLGNSRINVSNTEFDGQGLQIEHSDVTDVVTIADSTFENCNVGFWGGGPMSKINRSTFRKNDIGASVSWHTVVASSEFADNKNIGLTGPNILASECAFIDNLEVGLLDTQVLAAVRCVFTGNRTACKSCLIEVTFSGNVITKNTLGLCVDFNLIGRMPRTINQQSPELGLVRKNDIFGNGINVEASGVGRLDVNGIYLGPKAVSEVRNRAAFISGIRTTPTALVVVADVSAGVTVSDLPERLAKYLVVDIPKVVTVPKSPQLAVPKKQIDPYGGLSPSDRSQILALVTRLANALDRGFQVSERLTDEFLTSYAVNLYFQTHHPKSGLKLPVSTVREIVMRDFGVTLKRVIPQRDVKIDHGNLVLQSWGGDAPRTVSLDQVIPHGGNKLQFVGRVHIPEEDQVVGPVRVTVRRSGNHWIALSYHLTFAH